MESAREVNQVKLETIMAAFPMGDRNVCSVCGKPLPDTAQHRDTCSNACRVWKHRHPGQKRKPRK